MGRIRITASTSGPFSAWLARERRMLEVAVTEGMRAATEGMKLDIRQALAASGLGPRLGNAVGSAVYPERRASLAAAGQVFARGPAAERVLTAFAEGATIRARRGRFLAIPTEHVPRAGRGGQRPMTPFEVESHFNTDLEPVPLTNPSTAGAGALMLVIKVVRGQRRGFRRATSRRIAAGRSAEFVPMFILVPVVRLRRRLDAVAIHRKWITEVPHLIERALPPQA